MPDLCQSAELTTAGGYLNGLLAKHSFSAGCRIELGLKLMADAVSFLDADMRDEVVAALLERVFAMRDEPAAPPVIAGVMGHPAIMANLPELAAAAA